MLPWREQCAAFSAIIVLALGTFAGFYRKTIFTNS